MTTNKDQNSIQPQAALDLITDKAIQLIGQGHVADYIPALAQVDGHQFGIAICDLKGNIYQKGIAALNFRFRVSVSYLH